MISSLVLVATFMLMCLGGTIGSKLTGPPTVCQKGEFAWDKERIKAELNTFRKVYDNRPLHTESKQGSNLFHTLMQWCVIRLVKPKYVVESGTLLGWGSWLMRQAAGPDTHFIYISPWSPTETSRRRHNASYWEDPGLCTRLYGDKFVDFSQVNWAEVGIDTPEKLESTVIYFDDHQSGYRRLLEAQKAGFKHIMYDDGYPFPGDNFALKQACDEKALFYQVKDALRGISHPAHHSKVHYMDNFASISYDIDMDIKKCLYDSMMSRIDLYLEFPPLWSGTFRGQKAHNLDIMYMHPLLTHAEAEKYVAGFKNKVIPLAREAAGYTFCTYVVIKSQSELKYEEDQCLKNAVLVRNQEGAVH